MIQRKGKNLESEIKTIFEKTYHGFEHWYDIDRDIAEMFCYGGAADIPGEFLGKIHVKITYEEE